MNNAQKILIVAAHPDDEVLGCGGTAAKLISQGKEIYTLILGEGKTARGDVSSQEFDILKKETQNANRIIGIKEVFTSDFPDNRFDSVDLLDIVKEIEKFKKHLKPDAIFTHHYGDLNIDHQLTHKAVLTASRPMQGECTKEIYCFEVPSSTEWNAFSKEMAFIPNVFFDISDTIDLKIKAMAEYKSELREYPHPRSLQHIKELAKLNGAKVGLNYCENFVLARRIV